MCWTLADQGMDGTGGCLPPIGQGYGLVMAARSSLPWTRGRVYHLYLNFWPTLIYEDVQKVELSPQISICPLPCWELCCQIPVIGSRSVHAMVHSAGKSQILESHLILCI